MDSPLPNVSLVAAAAVSAIRIMLDHGLRRGRGHQPRHEISAMLLCVRSDRI